MNNLPIDGMDAATRARWLGELREVLERGLEQVGQILRVTPHDVEAAVLLARMMSALSDVDLLQRASGPGAIEIDPQSTNLRVHTPWGISPPPENGIK